MASVRPILARGTFYQPELDSLRFVAFLGVFLFHSMPHVAEFYAAYGIPASVVSVICGAISSGACGVDLFFALSAYLITSLLLRERETTGRLDVRNFYIRRILRIWPLYFGFILFAFVVPLAVKSQHHLDLRYVAGFVLLVGNWVYVLYGLPLHSFALPLWSISVEEQFYLSWPLIVRKTSRQMMAALAVLLLMVANLTRVTFAFRGSHQAAFEYSTLTRLDPIAMGILLALIAHRLPRFTTVQRLALLFASGAALVLVGMYCGLYPLDDITVNRWGEIIGRPVVAFASIAMLLAILGVRWMWIRNTALLYLGKISYGLYVVHSLGLKIASVLIQPEGLFGYVAQVGIGLTVTTILAAISYEYLETPFLHLKERFAHIASRPV